MVIPTWIEQLIANFTITKKISYGYSLALSVVILGTSAGLIIGNSYEAKARTRLLLAEGQIQIFHRLQSAVLEVRSHPRMLLTVLEDSIWFQYETSKFLEDVRQVKEILSELDTFVAQNSPQLGIEPSKIKQLLQNYRQLIDSETQLVQSIWQQVDPVKLNPKNLSLEQQKVLASLSGDEAKKLSIEFGRCSENLTLFINVAEKQQSQASQEMVKANVIQIYLIVGTMVVSMAIATMLAFHISRFIAHPLEALTKIAQRVTEEANFQLQAPVNTKDEVGTLAMSLNQLIRWVGEYTQKLEIARATLECRVEERTLALKEANEKLQRLVILDSLTQIANRRYFDEYLFQEWQRCLRQQQPLSLIMVDIDYFKLYNDYYGHQQGDNCLVQVAQAISLSVKRSTDLVARYGGEEFAVILPHTPSQGAIQVAKDIRNEVKQLQIPHPRSQVRNIVSLSLGISWVIPQRELSPEKLMKRADEALYQAKAQGRNCYCIQLLEIEPLRANRRLCS
jgi:diguanylate cyclase (GGDEF)-like protein